MYIKVMYNIKNNQNVEVVEKDKKRRKKSEKKIVCSEHDLNPIPSDYRSCTSPIRLKLQSAITPVKLYRFFSKVNQVIYSSSPIS